MNCKLVFYILLSVLLCSAKTLMAPLTVSQNKKYFNSDIVTIDTSSTYDNLSVTIWNPRSFNLSLPFVFTDTVSGIFLSITDLDVRYISGRISFSCMLQSLNQSSFAFQIYNNYSYTIKVLALRYLVYTNKYYDDYNWKQLTVIKSFEAANVTTTLSINLKTKLNLVGGVASFISYFGFDYQSQSTGAQFSLYSELQTPTGQQTTTLGLSIKSTGVYLHTYYAAVFVYNVLHYNSAKYAAFTIGSYSLTKPGSNKVVSPSNFYSPSLLLGFYAFKISLESGLNFKITINSPDQIALSTSIQRSFACTFQTVVFSTFYCSYATPFLYLKDGNCYDVCPPSSHMDQASTTCISVENTSDNSKGNGNGTNRADPVIQPDISDVPESNAKIIGIVIGMVLFVVLVGIILIICFCKKRRHAEDRNQEIRPQLVDLRQQNIQVNIQVRDTNYNPALRESASNIYASNATQPPVQELAKWKKRFKKFNRGHQCSICTHSFTFFKTSCYHFFHVKCIVEWSSRRDSCPNCNRQDIVGKNHRLFCRQCGMQQKWMRFSEIKQKYQEGKMEEETICEQCKAVPI